MSRDDAVVIADHMDPRVDVETVDWEAVAKFANVDSPSAETIQRVKEILATHCKIIDLGTAIIGLMEIEE